jgi:hypothetical protein
MCMLSRPFDDSHRHTPVAATSGTCLWDNFTVVTKAHIRINVNYDCVISSICQQQIQVFLVRSASSNQFLINHCPKYQATGLHHNICQAFQPIMWNTQLNKSFLNHIFIQLRLNNLINDHRKINIEPRVWQVNFTLQQSFHTNSWSNAVHIS